MRRLLFITFLFISLVSNAQETRYIASEKIKIFDVYPQDNNSESLKWLNYLKPNEEFYIYGINSKEGSVYVYNNLHTGKFLTSDKKFFKALKKAKIIDIVKEKNCADFNRKKKDIKNKIDTYYRLEAERKAKEARKKEIKDSLKLLEIKEQFKIDSLANYTKHYNDSIQFEERLKSYIEASVEKYKKGSEKVKSLYPIAVNVDSWGIGDLGEAFVSVSVLNCSPQTIKYITFGFKFYNPVGDVCRNWINGNTVWKVRGVGPIGPRWTLESSAKLEDSFGKYSFDESSFYVKLADKIRLVSITIQYMNGKTISLSGNALKNHVFWENNWIESPSFPINLTDNITEEIFTENDTVSNYKPLIFEDYIKNKYPELLFSYYKQNGNGDYISNGGVETMPSFPGNINQWLSQNLIYPAVAAENNIQGKVVVSFIVDRDGSIIAPHIVKSVDPALDREALNLVKRMPKWNPGSVNGKPARAIFTLPITFNLK